MLNSLLPYCHQLSHCRPVRPFLRRNSSLTQKLPSYSPERNPQAKQVRNDREGHPLTSRHAKRNQFGVQLLSRDLHAQLFKNVRFPPPPASYIQIAKDHLKQHGLDPTQGSSLPNTSFDLPPLQGVDISEHFHRIGLHAAEPWLNLSKSFAAQHVPPKPDNWHIQSGWTKYYYESDGSSYSEHVDFPVHNGQAEQMLTFDVETMPPYHPYAVMACAASPNAWYAWISPWLLGETDDPQHLIPLGDPSVHRVVVGHNVSYDRARILEEYSVQPSGNRFLDTMALHVAVSGISSHQRPAWAKYRKEKETEKEQRKEAAEAVANLIDSVEERRENETNEAKQAELSRLRDEMSDSLLLLQAGDSDDGSDAEISSKRWEDITAANSLADVAKLHCGIEVDKQIRNDFMVLNQEQIKENVLDYLEYCANDVLVTHQVFATVLPAFLSACPHPVSFAGALTMGSSFLTVNQEWKNYLERAERVYRDMEASVLHKLKKLAEDARAMMESGSWKDDPWLSQLDWNPKIAGRSRGIETLEEIPEQTEVQILKPLWYLQLTADPFSKTALDRILPLLLKLSFDGHSLAYSNSDRWHYVVDDTVTSPEFTKGKKITHMLSKKAASFMDEGRLTGVEPSLISSLALGSRGEDVVGRTLSLADSTLSMTEEEISLDPWLKQLDWTLVPVVSDNGEQPLVYKKPKKIKPVKAPPVFWPKWYWEATKPRKDAPPGALEITVRNRIAPILLRLSWLGWPLFHSREHGWTYRVRTDTDFKSRTSPLSFHDPLDDLLNEAALSGRYVFYKLPHKDGEKANVGSPLGKSFIKYAQDGTLKSPGDEAKEALDMNALCSYWISSRDRIMKQLVIWQDQGRSLGLTQGSDEWGIILPQVVTMGTVTRRAIEKTWLTASNAKKNRVGSELKAMVRAPPGYAIVGADVDSEELWISSCMGDAQFGAHGASAIGWMTLEGTKAAGTDLHSKTAAILGISRDQAKVFNYSRIYGAGMRHAILLLLQSNSKMLPEEAQKLSENLYASTKGKNTHRSDMFERKFWFGGSESYLFNKLEEIALSDQPRTPALGCRVTYALSKEYLPEGFGSDYLPSRINWVVQSSGVDYLHLLIVSMAHLIDKYDIKARYLISVHDEVRYLVAEEDKYRAALALQVANVWTRSLFAFKLGMDDLPQGVAFFSAVDIDSVLRKEVDMTCVTPSHPTPLPFGESLDIQALLPKTHNGSLRKDGASMKSSKDDKLVGSLDGYVVPDCLVHRAQTAAFLQAQATTDFGEVKGLAQFVYGRKFTDNAEPKKTKRRKKHAIGDGLQFDWSDTVDQVLAREPLD